MMMVISIELIRKLLLQFIETYILYIIYYTILYIQNTSHSSIVLEFDKVKVNLSVGGRDRFKNNSFIRKVSESESDLKDKYSLFI